MRVEVTFSGDGHPVTCHAANCPFLSRCANHTSAGEFRNEDGFSPELTADSSAFFCLTSERSAATDHMWLDFPVNHLELGHGEVTLGQVKRNSMNNQQRDAQREQLLAALGEYWFFHPKLVLQELLTELVLELGDEVSQPVDDQLLLDLLMKKNTR